MKIATWNLERGGRTSAARAAQRELLASLDADVVALTEPPASYREGPGVAISPARRAGPSGAESWAAIVASVVEPLPFEIPYERMAVAARVHVRDEHVIVYCAVLPWLSITNHAPEVLKPGEGSADAFTRVLAEQAADVVELHRRFGDPVIWAGDFNQSLAGPLAGGSRSRRALLERTLSAIGYTAWNAHAAHAVAGLCAIDLVCGPSSRAVIAQGRIEPVRVGIPMSDHAGYWVEIA